MASLETQSAKVHISLILLDVHKKFPLQNDGGILNASFSGQIGIESLNEALIWAARSLVVSRDLSKSLN